MDALVVILGAGAWAIGPWAVSAWHRRRALRAFHDARSRRELLWALALLAAGIASTLSLVAGYLIDFGDPFPLLLRGIAIGTFGAAGLIVALEEP